MVWDEENRLRGINDNGRLHLYTYDHTGERALKSSAESSMAVINGATSAIITHTEDYTAYVSPYFVVNKGKFTKHYFEGSSRVVSKLGEGTFVHKNTGIMAGGLDYLRQTAEQQRIRDEYIKGLQVPPGPPTQHGIYTTPEWTGEAYPSIDWSEVSQNQEPPTGWPRPPKFNEPGDVPGPPVQFGPPVTNANVKAGHGFIPNGVEEKNLYYYHPDHLGSSSYITNKDGEVIQHTEYIAFGEVLVDEHSTTNKMPYLFNGKELDFETGLYYYGARYYDPKISIFLNVDPLAGKAPNWTPYRYGFNNPVKYIDPKGLFETKFGAWWHRMWNGGKNSSHIKFDDRRNEYYYLRGNMSRGDEINLTAVYSNSKRSAGELVFQVEGKATLGVQAGIRVPFGTAEVGVMTGEIGKIGWSSREKGNGFYAKHGDGKGHNYLGLGAGVDAIKASVGGKIDYVTNDIIPTAGDLLDYYPNNGSWNIEGSIGPKVNLGGLPNESLSPIIDSRIKQRVRSGTSESCSICIDISGAVKLIIGVEGKIRIGFTGKDD